MAGIRFVAESKKSHVTVTSCCCRWTIKIEKYRSLFYSNKEKVLCADVLLWDNLISILCYWIANALFYFLLKRMKAADGNDDIQMEDVMGDDFY